MRGTPMGSESDDTISEDASSADLGLTPDQRLDAIADILVRGLARLIVAEDSAQPKEAAGQAQAMEITSEVALLNGGGDALMVGRGQVRAAKGGRTR